jgi:hypothetical protein
MPERFKVNAPSAGGKACHARGARMARLKKMLA